MMQAFLNRSHPEVDATCVQLPTCDMLGAIAITGKMLVTIVVVPCPLASTNRH